MVRYPKSELLATSVSQSIPTRTYVRHIKKTAKTHENKIFEEKLARVFPQNETERCSNKQWNEWSAGFDSGDCTCQSLANRDMAVTKLLNLERFFITDFQLSR